VGELLPQVRALNTQLLQALSAAEVDALDQALSRLQQQALRLQQSDSTPTCPGGPPPRRPPAFAKREQCLRHGQWTARPALRTAAP
jgi:hypothetical protein